MSAKAETVVTAILTSIFALISCGGDEHVQANDEETQASTAARASAERTIGQTASERTASEPATGREGGAIARAGDDVVARAGDGAVARAGDAEARANSGEEVVGKNARGARRVMLEVGGDDGTRFSGACSVGGEVKSISGRVPVLYDYRPGGDKLECEIHKEGGGALEVVLNAGNNVRAVQRTNARESAITFTYSGGNISTSMSGSSG